MSLIGIPLGAFVGALSGFLFLLILRAGFQSVGIKQVSAILAELAALVSFALGGSWFANSSMLKGAEPTDILSLYMLSFAVVFFAVVAMPFYRLVVRFGNQFAIIEQIAPEPGSEQGKTDTEARDD